MEGVNLMNSILIIMAFIISSGFFYYAHTSKERAIKHKRELDEILANTQDSLDILARVIEKK